MYNLLKNDLTTTFKKEVTIGMEIIHVTAECYPVAKAGGLGDVVGALPKYQAELGHVAKVIMPMYRTKFLYDNQWELVHQGARSLAGIGFNTTSSRKKTINSVSIFIS